MVKQTGDVNQVVNRIRGLLEEGQLQEALAMAQAHLRSGSKMLASARGVCLMRAGRFEEAAKVLGDIVYPHGNLAMDRDLPVKVKINLATAMLLCQNVDGCVKVLSQVEEPQEPTKIKLQTAISKWKKSLSVFERLQCIWSTPNKPVQLDFPPGEV